jgi:hypothetical protein
VLSRQRDRLVPTAKRQEAGFSNWAGCPAGNREYWQPAIGARLADGQRTLERLTAPSPRRLPSTHRRLRDDGDSRSQAFWVNLKPDVVYPVGLRGRTRYPTWLDPCGFLRPAIFDALFTDAGRRPPPMVRGPGRWPRDCTRSIQAFRPEP